MINYLLTIVLAPYELYKYKVKDTIKSCLHAAINTIENTSLFIEYKLNTLGTHNKNSQSKSNMIIFVI